MSDDLSIGNDVTMRTSASDALAVIDQFEILRKLGGGGFGSVYLARDTVAGVEVAVKGLPPIVRNNTEELERIRSNFALVSRLHHPYIAAALHLHRVQLADYRVNGVYEELHVGPGDTLMVMEYAPGVTLSQWRKQFSDGKVPLATAANLAYQVAIALDYSHAYQVLHRDVKPSNIMVETQADGSSVVRVLDFGLAAEIKSSMGRVSMEIHDTTGTRPYMAPEQWAGRKQGPATDQYALACLFCELVTGEVPFASVFETGDPMVMMTAVCNREAELPADCPRQHALKKALSKDPKDRYATCVEFVENLAKSESRFDAEHGIAVKQTRQRPVFTPVRVTENPSAKAHASSGWKPNRVLALALILALGAAVCAGMAWVRRGTDRKTVVPYPVNRPARIAKLKTVGTQATKDASPFVKKASDPETVDDADCDHDNDPDPVSRISHTRKVIRTTADGGEKWRYVTTVPPSDWYEIDADDTNWEVGRGVFSDGTITPKEIARMTGSKWDGHTIWLRKGFSCSRLNRSSVGKIILSCMVRGSDERNACFEIWINAKRIDVRPKMAGKDYVGSEYQEFDITSQVRDVLSYDGDNLLAVKCRDGRDERWSYWTRFVDVGLTIFERDTPVRATRAHP